MNDHVDMAQFVEAKSDQLNSDDLIGSPRTITVRKVTGNDGDQPVSIFFDGDNNKPFRPCKTMRRVLLAVWGRNAADYVGRSMTLYRDDSVQFGGLNVGGIRISHMSNIEKETIVVAMKSKGKKAPIKIAPLVVQRKNPTKSNPIAPIEAPDAETWAKKFVESASACADADQLNALVSRESKWLDQLSETLRADCDAAVSDKLAVFFPTEGRTDEQHGDQFPDE